MISLRVGTARLASLTARGSCPCLAREAFFAAIFAASWTLMVGNRPMPSCTRRPLTLTFCSQ